MHVRTQLGLCLFALSFVLFGAVADAQSQEELAYSAVVIHDTNGDGSRDENELQLGGWELSVFTSSDTEASYQTLSSSESTVQIPAIESDGRLCLTPRGDWQMTAPITTVGHPNDAAWYCYQLSVTDTPQEFEFFVTATDQESPEEIPNLINEENTDATEKQQLPQNPGTVLGITDENGAVLAETGVYIWLPVVAGFCLFFSSVALAYRAKKD